MQLQRDFSKVFRRPLATQAAMAAFALGAHAPLRGHDMPSSDGRVGDINPALFNPDLLKRAVQGFAAKQAQPKIDLSEAGLLRHIGDRVIGASVNPDYILAHDSGAVAIAAGADADVSITNTFSDYLLLDLVIGDLISQSWAVKSFYIARERDLIENAKLMSAQSWSTHARSRFQRGPVDLDKNDVIHLVVTNISAAAARFLADWRVKDKKPPNCRR